MSDIGRRTLLRGFGGLGASCLLSSCGEDPAPLTAGTVEPRLWTHDPSYVQTFQTAVTDPVLMKGSPFTYRLAMTKAAPSDIVTRMITQAVADGTTPDLVGLVIDQFPRVMRSSIAANLLVDLTPVAAPLGDELLKLEPYSLTGIPYGLDSDNSITVLFYREDLFQQFQIPRDVGTWEELAEHGSRVRHDHGASIGMVSTGDNGAVVNGFLQLLWQRGGTAFTKSGELALDTPEAVEVLEFMARGTRDGFLLALPDPYGSACAAALKSGKLIATAMPNWYNVYGLQANVPDQKGKWRIRTLPRFTAGGHVGSTLGGTGFAVLKDKPNTEAALDLLRRVYLTREGQLLRYRTGGFMPTLRSLYQDPELLAERDEYLGGQKVFDVYGKAAADLPTFYQSAGMQILTATLGGPVLDALKGRTTPAAAIKAGIEAYREQVKR